MFSPQQRTKNIVSMYDVIYKVMSSHRNLLPEMIVRRTVVHAQTHFSRVWVYHDTNVKIIIIIIADRNSD